MSQKVWKRNFAAGHGLEQVLAVTKNPGPEVPIPFPPSTVRHPRQPKFSSSPFLAH